MLLLVGSTLDLVLPLVVVFLQSCSNSVALPRGSHVLWPWPQFGMPGFGFEMSSRGPFYPPHKTIRPLASEVDQPDCQTDQRELTGRHGLSRRLGHEKLIFSIVFSNSLNSNFGIIEPSWELSLLSSLP